LRWELVELAEGNARHKRERERGRGRESERERQHAQGRHAKEKSQLCREGDSSGPDPQLTSSTTTLRSIRYEYYCKDDGAGTACTGQMHSQYVYVSVYHDFATHPLFALELFNSDIHTPDRHHSAQSRYPEQQPLQVLVGLACNLGSFVASFQKCIAGQAMLHSDTLVWCHLDTQLFCWGTQPYLATHLVPL